MTRVFFCGQAPSRAGDGRPFSGPSGRRLVSLIGLEDYEALEQSFTLTNIFQDPAEPQSAPGDPFDKKLARDLGKHMMVAIADYDPDSVVIACGHQVFRALTGEDVPFYNGRGVEGVMVWCFPHPSGTSRYWNNPENVEQAARFLRRLLKRSGFEGA